MTVAERVREESTGEFPISRTKGPEDIIVEFYYGTFWEAVKTAKFYGELAACRDVIQARLDFPGIRDMQRGAWLAEGAVFYPSEKVILVSPRYNPLFKDLKQTEACFSRQKGLLIEDLTAGEIANLAEKDSSLPPAERNALVLPWTCYPRRGAGVSFNNAAKDELTLFLFKDRAEEYGSKNGLVNACLSGFGFEFKPCEENPSSYAQPFALPLLLNKIDAGSRVEVFERGDFVQYLNFAVDKRKGVYGIPNRAKERRLRQFGRILSTHGVTDPQVLDDILSKHSPK